MGERHGKELPWFLTAVRLESLIWVPFGSLAPARWRNLPLQENTLTEMANKGMWELLI